jgi:RES domain-containing protein
VSLSAWRIVKRKYASSAFGGEGARLFGGRWNNPGVAMVYTAQSQSLAALELLVHLDSSELLATYVVFEVRIDASLVARLDFGELPRNWRADPPPDRLRDIGDAWVAAQSSAVLRTPSTVVPAEHNFLLNPKHPDFARLRIGKPSPFRFDRRLAD